MTTRGSLPGEDGLVQVLDENGALHDEATLPDVDDETMVEMYEQMRFARHLDDRATTLHRQGRMGTYPPLGGQEAAQVASAHALADDDWISFQYREHGAVAARDLSADYLIYWMGYEEGNGSLADRYVFPLNISIGSQIPHATGMAWASKLREDDRTVLCHFGDGATSEGDFHEGLNFAGVFDVPVVFFCNNNQYAISVGREDQSASATIAQKAAAYGFRGRRVDGMDPLAVYAVTKAAVERATDPAATVPESGAGRAAHPTLIEAVMYRLGPHTTVDDPGVYRDKTEVERWRRYDPIPRFEAFLRGRGLLDDVLIDSIEQRIETAVATMVEKAQGVRPDPDAMFERPYESQPPRVDEQRRLLRDLRNRHGDDELLRDE